MQGRSIPHIGRRTILGGIGVLAAPAIVRAQGANGVALVIGNSAYKWESLLPNVKRDVLSITKHFEELGLKTTLLMDANREVMRSALDRLKSQATGAPFAAIYYAGHGIISDDGRYVVPVDANFALPDLKQQLILANDLRIATSSAFYRILFFDSCRNNPAEGWRQIEAQRQAVLPSDGLYRQDFSKLVGRNLTEIYSTAPGHIALDGPAGQNSPFATAFLRHFRGTILNIDKIVEKMRRDVLVLTKAQQVIFSLTNWDDALTLPAPIKTTRLSEVEGVVLESIDKSRIVELPKAHAFASQTGLFLPGGLVAIRPEHTYPNNHIIGSFYTKTQNKFGVHPFILIVLSAEQPNETKIIYVTKSSSDGIRSIWRFTPASFSKRTLEVISHTAGADNLSFRWKNDDTGQFKQEQDSTSAGQGVKRFPFSADFFRLDS